MKKLPILILTIAIMSSLGAMAQSSFKSKLPARAQKGVTVYGTVECDGKPLTGVSVSDGYNIVKTDKKGVYNLKSSKRNPQIFITAPKGYESPRNGAVSEFWADFTEPADKAERHDFRLNKVDNTNHALVVITDIHLIGKQDDLPTFAKYVDVIREATDSLTKAGVPVYSIGLGDTSYDKHWYETGMDIEASGKILEANNWPFPLYNVVGNHDGDGAVCAGDSTDFLSSFRYMRTYGPRYHSQNFGNVHVVFLDNIYYKNTPVEKSGLEGVNGKRNYVDSITPEQLAWLRLDLQQISHDTPLIIATHSPIHQYRNIDPTPELKSKDASTKELLDIVKPYSKLQFISGHSHKNNVLRPEINGNKVLDRNLTATCGYIWWNTGMHQKNIGFDGSPAGFDLYSVKGDDRKFRFVPFEEPADHQYKAWDVNSLKEYFATNHEIQVMRRHHPKWGDFSNLPDNSILVQVWAWDPDGKLTATENGRNITPEMIYEMNPDFFAKTMLQKCEWMGDYKKAFNNAQKFRMFLIPASDASSPVEITYTDAFGRTDSRVFNRPNPYILD